MNDKMCIPSNPFCIQFVSFLDILGTIVTILELTIL